MKKEVEIQNSYIGIDVSKLTIDVSIINLTGEHDYRQFENGQKGFKNLENWLRNKDFFSIKKSLFCLEHTGLYTRQLVSFLLQHEANVWMESALHLKRSMGMTRGKNDKVDSYRIARYAMTNADKAQILKLSSSTLQLRLAYVSALIIFLSTYLKLCLCLLILRCLEALFVYAQRDLRNVYNLGDY